MRTMLSILALMLLLSSGCWYYSFTDKPYPNIETVQIEYIENNTTEFDLADIITQDMIDEIDKSGIVKVISSNADAVISGSVTKYERTIHTYTEDEQPEEYRITISVRLKFYDSMSEKLLWESNFEGYGTYESNTDDTEAKEEALEILIQRIIEGIREG